MIGNGLRGFVSDTSLLKPFPPSLPSSYIIWLDVGAMRISFTVNKHVFGNAYRTAGKVPYSIIGIIAFVSFLFQV